MAYEEDDTGATSQTSYGLAYNPLLPMGDPMAYARTRAASGDMSAPVNTFAPVDIRSYYPGPGGVMMPGGTANVPMPPRRGGGEEPNQLQPSQPQANAMLPDQSINSLQQLLQMKGLMSLASGQTGTMAPETSPTSAGGHSVAPAGASAVNAGPYEDAVKATAAKYGIDEGLLKKQLWEESRFDPHAVSSAGAVGVGQFMPATAKQYGLTDRTDPIASIDAAGHYMQDLLKKYNGNQQLALAAYNAGPGNVDKWLGGNWNLRKETTDYVKTITGRELVNPNVAASATTPKAFTVPGGGEFKLPGVEPGVSPRMMGARAELPESSKQPGGPYVGSVYDETTKKWRDVRPGEIAGSSVGGGTEIGRSGTGPGAGGRGVIAGGKLAEEGGKPEGAANKPAPDVQPTEARTPFEPQGLLSDEGMQKLWRFMLMRSLFPQLQFRNVGYDPWAVHRWGQQGGF